MVVMGQGEQHYNIIEIGQGVHQDDTVNIGQQIGQDSMVEKGQGEVKTAWLKWDKEYNRTE